MADKFSAHQEDQIDSVNHMLERTLLSEPMTANAFRHHVESLCGFGEERQLIRDTIGHVLYSGQYPVCYDQLNSEPYTDLAVTDLILYALVDKKVTQAMELLEGTDQLKELRRKVSLINDQPGDEFIRNSIRQALNKQTIIFRSDITNEDERKIVCAALTTVVYNDLNKKGGAWVNMLWNAKPDPRREK